MKAHKRRKRASILEHYRYNILASSIVGIVAVVLCVSLCAIIVSIADVSIKVISILSCICLGVGSYIAGYISAIKRQKSGILSGVLCGIIISSIIIILGNIVNDSGISTKLCKLVICITCSSIGGIKSANSHTI